MRVSGYGANPWVRHCRIRQPQGDRPYSLKVTAGATGRYEYNDVSTVFARRAHPVVRLSGYEQVDEVNLCCVSGHITVVIDEDMMAVPVDAGGVDVGGRRVECRLCERTRFN